MWGAAWQAVWRTLLGWGGAVASASATTRPTPEVAVAGAAVAGVGVAGVGVAGVRVAGVRVAGVRVAAPRGVYSSRWGEPPQRRPLRPPVCLVASRAAHESVAGGRRRRGRRRRERRRGWRRRGWRVAPCQTRSPTAPRYSCGAWLARLRRGPRLGRLRRWARAAAGCTRSDANGLRWGAWQRRLRRLRRRRGLS